MTKSMEEQREYIQIQCSYIYVWNYFKQPSCRLLAPAYFTECIVNVNLLKYYLLLQLRKCNL